MDNYCIEYAETSGIIRPLIEVRNCNEAIIEMKKTKKVSPHVLCSICYFKHRNTTMCKMKFTLNGIVGHPYGSSFVVRDGQLAKASSYDLDGCSADQGIKDSVVFDEIS